MKPLDLVCFSGSDFMASMVKFLEKVTMGQDQFSHVGLLVNSTLLPDIPQLLPNKWYVWESTLSGSNPDVRDRKAKLGVQIRSLDSLISTYPGSISIAPLLNNPWDQVNRREQIITIVRQLYSRHGSQLYDCNPISLLASAFPACRPRRDVFEAKQEEWLTMVGMGKYRQLIFCSELVALIYVGLGVMTGDPRDVLPMDFFGADIDGTPRLVDEPFSIKS